MREYIHSDFSALEISSSTTRLLANVIDGFIKFENSDIEAQVLPPGGDWGLWHNSAEYVRLDARARAKTDKGEMYIQYTGTMILDQGGRKLMEKAPDAGPTNYGDTTWFTYLTVETTDERLKWMEAAALVGEGRWHIDEKGFAAEYLVYQLEN